MHKPNTYTKQDYLNTAIWGFMAFMIFISAMAPRLWGVAPAIFGLLAYISAQRITGSWPVISRDYLILAAGTAVLACASFFWSDYPASVISRVESLLPVLLGGAFLAAVAVQVKLSDTAMKFLFGAFICGLLLVFFNLKTDMALHKFVNGMAMSEDMPLHHMNRPLCVYIVLFWPVMFMLRQSPIRKSAGALLASLLLLCLVFSSSQSAQLALIASTLVYFAHSFRPRVVIWGIFALIVAGTYAMPFVIPEIFDAVKDFERLPRQYGYPLLRLEMWDFISDAIRQNLALGYGIEATKNMVFETDMIYLPHNTTLHPHNMTLQIWIEFGLVGITAYLAGLFYFFKRIFTLPDKVQTIALCTFVAIFSISNTGYGLWQGWWIGLIVSAVALFGMVVKPPIDS